jgi:hypothetical protein
MDFATSESELYLDYESAFLRRAEKAGALSKVCPLKKELEREEQYLLDTQWISQFPANF